MPLTLFRLNSFIGLGFRLERLNSLVAERRKRQLSGVEAHFWRLSSGAEVDYVEVEAGELRAFEFKLSPKARAKAPASWVEGYPGAPWQKIDRENYLPFIAG